MAKWGEGDPRWIVEERADAKNVNNWHWTEKNATGWSKEKIKCLLEKLKIEDNEVSCEVDELTTIDGEASANNRKAKLIFFYEWLIKGTWAGKLRNSSDTWKGKLEIPNLSEENSADELDVQVTVDNDHEEEAYKIKEYMRTKGADKIKQQLACYIKDLKEEFSQGMIVNVDNKKAKPVLPKNEIKEKISQPVSGGKVTSGVKIRTKSLNTTEQFKCRSMELYRALTEQEMVQAFTRAPAAVDASKGGSFSLYDGNVTGTFTALIPFETISMRWRFKSWPEGHYSDVTIKLDEKEDCTVLSLTQKGIPENEYDMTSSGWSRHYWECIRGTFGFAARLF